MSLPELIDRRARVRRRRRRCCSTRTICPSVASARSYSSRTVPRPSTLLSCSRRTSSSSSSMSRSAGAVIVTPDSARTLVASTWSGPSCVRFTPIPTTTANRSSTATISASRPAIFASSTIRSFGHLSVGRTPLSRTRAARAARATHATTSWSWSGPTSGRSRIEHSSDAPAGDSQRRSRRPRPALWKSATATRPSGAPSRARSAVQVFVESITSKCSVRQTIELTRKQ